MRTILFDIDGVLADCTHRLHFIQNGKKDWDAFFDACVDDAPIEANIRFLWAMQEYFRVIFITGRPERIRKATMDWFNKHGILFRANDFIIMRRDGDYRPDFEVKRELFRKWIDQTSVIAVIEDRDQVVEMWRAEGLLCLQPKKGDY
jgi:phosphoglycolate phosphatase-like HAD superfamily hydrolase